MKENKYLTDTEVNAAVNEAMKESNRLRSGTWSTWGKPARVLIALANDRKNLLKRIKELEELIKAVA